MNSQLSHVIQRHTKFLVLVTVLSIFNHNSLKLSDYLLATYMDGYESSNAYLIPAIVFFIAAYAVTYFGFKYGWKRMLPYQLCATAIFFPLIFLTSVARFFTGFLPETYEFYAMEVCGIEVGPLLCGQALAHMIFCDTVRALPLMLIIPAVFYCLLKINFLNLQACYELG